MRYLRKSALEDISVVCHYDTKSASGGRREFLERAVQKGSGYTLEQDGQPIGIGILEYTFFEHGFISLIYVSPSARRTGAGEMLLQYLVSICGTPKVFSSTNQSNGPMQELFAKAGFERSGVIHNLDLNDPEIVYYKEVKR